MKKKILLCIVVVAFISFTTINVKMSNQAKIAVNFSLNGIEAAAAGESGGGDFFACDRRTCQVHYGMPPYVVVKDGYWEKCVPATRGSKRCDCDTDCDAGIGG